MTKDVTIRSRVIPPPYMGINTRVPISQMGAEYALEMENWIPRSGECEIRKGTSRFCTSSMINNARLAVYNYNGVDKLLRYGLQVEDISTGTPSVISGALVFSGLSRHQFYKDRIFFTGSTSDHVYYWTGTGTVTASSYTGPGGSDLLLGAMAVYKNRLYFAHYNGISSLPELWYSNYDSTSGSLTQYPLNSLLSLGGHVTFIGRITRAKSYQEDEILVAITNNGEVLLFSGDNPGSVSWQLIGKYFIPKPLTEDSICFYGADIYVMTTLGIISISAVMDGQYANPGSYSEVGYGISGPIQKDYLAAVSNGLYTYSWGVHHTGEGLLVFNISTGTGVSPDSIQFVMNTDTGAWSKLAGMKMSYGAMWNNVMYYVEQDGNTAPYGVVMKAFDGYVDVDPKTGSTQSRNLVLRPAYNFFDEPGRKKKMLFAVPHMYQSEGMQLTMDADMDFQNVAATQTVTPDNADTSYKYYAPKVGLNGYGKCASIRIDQTVTTKRMSLQAIEVFYEQGTVL